MKRPVESLQDFRTRIAAIVGDKPEQSRGSPTASDVGAQEASDQNTETAATMNVQSSKRVRRLTFFTMRREL
jgi:hypothetical protein